VAPGTVGGIESVVRALAGGHARRGHAVRVVAILDAPDDGRHPWLAALREDGIETVALHLPGRRYLRERTEIAALCRRLAPDVVHSHGYRPDVIGAGAARAAGVATVTTVHGFTGGGWKNRVYERIQLRAFRRFDAVVAVSRPLVDRLAGAGVRRERLHLLPNAFDDDAPRLDRAAARRALALPDDAFVVGWVGRLGREKGGDVLLEALAAGGAPPAVASFLGDGREREALAARAAELGIADRVRWHGTVRDAGRHFAAFDAFALSSRTEGTPIVLFEAMAAGVPIVATRVGGVPDVVTEGEALIVPPESPAALAAALAEVHRDRAGAASRARRARERLAERYALAPWLDRYDAIYRQVRRTPSTPR
jgi:glycosyltransferase involved in cell wall biosynthesis